MKRSSTTYMKKGRGSSQVPEVSVSSIYNYGNGGTIDFTKAKITKSRMDGEQFTRSMS